MSTTDDAVALAAKGFRVFVLHGVKDGVCSCMEGADCKRPGKHPRAKSWQEAATNNPVVAKALFESWFTANIGIATGQGLVVVDCDTVEAERLFVESFPFDPTYCVRTRQGTHFYFTYDPTLKLRTVTAWLPGIDIRAEGGLVVAPGSTHQTGLVYSQCDGSPELPSACPTALITVLPRVFERKRTDAKARVQATVEMDRADAVMEEMFLTPMRTAAGGGRNATLFKLACRLYELIHLGLLFGSRLDQLAQVAESSGLTAVEINRTIRSALQRLQ